MQKKKFNLPTLVVILGCLFGSIVFILLIAQQLANPRESITQNAVQNGQVLSQNTPTPFAAHGIGDGDRRTNDVQESPIASEEPAISKPGAVQNDSGTTQSAIIITPSDEVQAESDPSPTPITGYSSKEAVAKSAPAKPSLTPPPAPGSKATPTPVPAATPTPLPRTTVPDSENPFMNVPAGEATGEDGTTIHGADGSGDKF
jgi:hypothetical protein